MGPYRTIQDHTEPRRTIRDHTGPYKTIQDCRRPYGTIRDHTRPYRTIQDHTRPYNHLGPYGTILDHTRPYRTILGHKTSRKFLGYFKCVSRKFQGCFGSVFKGVWRKLQRSFIALLRESPGVSRKFPGFSWNLDPKPPQGYFDTFSWASENQGTQLKIRQDIWTQGL